MVILCMNIHCVVDMAMQISLSYYQEEQSSEWQCLLDCPSMLWSGAHCWHLDELSQNTALLTTQDLDWC